MATIGVSASIDIILAIQEAWKYINRDKNKLCRALDAIALEIDNFYGDVNTYFGEEAGSIDLLGKSYRMPEQSSRQISKFLTQYQHSGVIDVINTFIKGVIQKYRAGELRRIVDRINPARLRRISDNLNLFRKTVQEEKMGYYLSLISSEQSDIRKRGNIRFWLRTLNSYRESRMIS